MHGGESAVVRCAVYLWQHAVGVTQANLTQGLRGGQEAWRVATHAVKLNTSAECVSERTASPVANGCVSAQLAETIARQPWQLRQGNVSLRWCG